jgi:hypothetical protein
MNYAFLMIIFTLATYQDGVSTQTSIKQVNFTHQEQCLQARKIIYQISPTNKTGRKKVHVWLDAQTKVTECFEIGKFVDYTKK